MSFENELDGIKQTLLEDLKKSITYTPDRKRDIYLMMNRYMSGGLSDKKKEKILTNLTKCINGLSYKQPKGAVTKKYTMDEVEELNDLLDKFFEDAKKNPEKIKELSEMLEEQIIDLDAETERYLIEPWREDMLQDWYDLACEAAISYDNFESKDFGKYGMKME